MACAMTPRVRALIIRKTQVSMTSTALVTWREHVIPDELSSGIIRYYGGSMVEPAQYIYPHGSRVMLGGMDKPTKIMSSEYDLIYVQEAIELTEADWDALSTRLRNGRLSYQQLIADTNPDKPTHWIKARAHRGDVTMLESRHSDNPILVGEDGQYTERGAQYLGRLDKLTGVRHARLRKGLWVAAEGVIYEEYDESVHLIDRFDIPKEWDRIWSVDFGFTHPFVLQCWAIDPDGRMYLYREIYHTRRRVDRHARDILAVVTDPESRTAADGTEVPPARWEWIEPRPSAIICDHDAESRATLSEVIGMPTRPADKRVTEGLQEMQRWLQVADDGRPRMSFMRDSVIETDQELREARAPASTVEEITGYVWDERKEAPVKNEDDGMDTARYAVMSRRRHGVSVRWL